MKISARTNFLLFWQMCENVRGQKCAFKNLPSDSIAHRRKGDMLTFLRGAVTDLRLDFQKIKNPII